MRFVEKEILDKKPESLDSFGDVFTDYMFVVDYNNKDKWHDARIVPFGSLPFTPANSIFHYGQGIFEGMKAYRTPEGEINLFRPEENFKRLNNSAKRLSMPTIDIEFAVDALKKLVDIEKDWVPTDPSKSLYIRPIMIADDDFLGVKRAEKYKLIYVLSPVASFYEEGLDPVSIIVEDQFVRAVKGGLGAAKTMANYAASLLAGDNAKRKGYSQVLWLDGLERKYIEEVGTMNIFFKIEDRVVTPELNGSILPGITRDSIIKILKHWSIPVSEEKVSIDYIVESYKSGKLKEIFGTGTAAVISPVSDLHYKGLDMFIGDYNEESLSQKLYNYLTDLQYGRTKDVFNWTERL